MPSPIPARIIQTGKDREQPLLVRAAVANLRLLNPDFDYVFFDDAEVERFIDREFPQYRAIFDSFVFPIQRYDFFRYLAVYCLGGFYFDLDVLLAAGLADLLGRECVFPFEGLTFSRYLRHRCGIDWQIGNYAFGAAPGHPFLRAVIDNCVRAQQDPTWAEPMMAGAPALTRSEFLVLNTTGPGLLTRTLAENLPLAERILVLFPHDVCDTATWNRFGDLGVHLMDGSWRTGRGGLLRRRLATYWEDRVMRGLIKESAALGATRQLGVLR